jgi:hypothetical protein
MVTDTGSACEAAPLIVAVYSEDRASLDLRLMHHYCVFTTQYFASNSPESVSTASKVDVPQPAFQHRFLIDTILLVAMVHLGCSETTSRETSPSCTLPAGTTI